MSKLAESHERQQSTEEMLELTEEELEAATARLEDTARQLHRKEVEMVALDKARSDTQAVVAALAVHVTATPADGQQNCWTTASVRPWLRGARSYIADPERQSETKLERRRETERDRARDRRRETERDRARDRRRETHR